MNALDNVDARRHVNRLCLAADKPLIESGTQGYKGQCRPILKGTEVKTLWTCDLAVAFLVFRVYSRKCSSTISSMHAARYSGSTSPLYASESFLWSRNLFVSYYVFSRHRMGKSYVCTLFRPRWFLRELNAANIKVDEENICRDEYIPLFDSDSQPFGIRVLQVLWNVLRMLIQNFSSFISILR